MKVCFHSFSISSCSALTTRRFTQTLQVIFNYNCFCNIMIFLHIFLTFHPHICYVKCGATFNNITSDFNEKILKDVVLILERWSTHSSY